MSQSRISAPAVSQGFTTGFPLTVASAAGLFALPLGRRGASRLGVLLALGSLFTLPLSAFPPAPFHTIYGTVRDSSGQAIAVDGAAVVFYKDDVEVMRQNIVHTGARPDQNYQLRLRMDMQRAGTRTYSSLANNTGATYTLSIVINDVRYSPIGLSTPLTVGKPGERVRLDLTVGIDFDGDGIPDDWEQSQLSAAGIGPGADGWDLSLLNREGDFDGDGHSDWNEYIAGTFATDATDFIMLEVTYLFPESLRLTFFAVHDRTYSLETSTDLQNWYPAPFYLANPAPETEGDGAGEEPEYPTDIYDPEAPPAMLTAFHSEATEFINIYALLAEPGVFYRLKVQ